MLYEKFNKRKVKDFEFLRSPKGGEHLIGISREKYFEQNPYIHDLYDPYRTDLLSVACFPWQQSFSLYLYNFSYNNKMPFFNLIQKALKEYGLPAPSDLPHIPFQKKGILFHILIAPDVTEKITYEGSSSPPYGRPILSSDLLSSTQALREKASHYKSFWTPPEGRIITDPTYISQPTKLLKIFRFQEDDDHDACKEWAKNVIAQAEKLKEELTLDKCKTLPA